MKPYLGIDVGGSTIKSALVDFRDMALREKREIPTPKDKREFLRALRELVDSNKPHVSGIGVGLPGMIDASRGFLMHAEHLPFLNKWNASSFFESFDLPMKFDNDSRCFLRAEWMAGVARGYRNVLGITVGSGIGGSLVIDGKLYYGAHGSAGEFGHMQIEKDATFETLGAKAAYEKFGDRSHVIGIGIANLVNAFDPEIVVLGGGGIFSSNINFGVAQKTAIALIKSPPAKRTPVVKGVHGGWAQTLGAVLLFRGNKKP